MINIKNPMTAQAPSTFVMPISGTTTGVTSARTSACATSVVRDRMGAVVEAVQTVKGADQGIALGYFPGTTAWRPPNC